MSSNSPREASLWALLDEIRAGQRATDLVDDAASKLMGVNRTDGRCLDILLQLGRMSAGALAAEARLTSGAITAVIDRLERAGYAHRVADPEDRRRVLVEATPKAFVTAEELMARMGEIGFGKTNEYSDEELELLVDFMRFSRKLQEEHAEWLREKLRERSAGS
jgi:DNA-binding MarR family transcriptional regulator